MKPCRKSIASVFLSSVFALSVLAPGARAEGFHCPNERATIVGGHNHELGPFDQCDRYLSLFGLELIIGDRPCPATVLFHPAHGECLGKKSEGERCAGNGTVSETTKDCSCMPRNDADLGVTSERCVCRVPTVSGFLQHSETRQCPDRRDPEEPEPTEASQAVGSASAWGAR